MFLFIEKCNRPHVDEDASYCEYYINLLHGGFSKEAGYPPFFNLWTPLFAVTHVYNRIPVTHSFCFQHWLTVSGDKELMQLLVFDAKITEGSYKSSKWAAKDRIECVFSSFLFLITKPQCHMISIC